MDAPRSTDGGPSVNAGHPLGITRCHRAALHDDLRMFSPSSEGARRRQPRVFEIPPASRRPRLFLKARKSAQQSERAFRACHLPTASVASGASGVESSAVLATESALDQLHRCPQSWGKLRRRNDPIPGRKRRGGAGLDPSRLIRSPQRARGINSEVACNAWVRRSHPIPDGVCSFAILGSGQARGSLFAMTQPEHVWRYHKIL